MSNIYRDVTLNQVSEQDIGKTIRVAGWVENIRDHGGVSFIDLRDMYAVMQIVIRDGKLLEGIRKEQAITVEGLIEKRDEETYNPKIPTGTIELDAKEVTVLGEVYSQLPFEVMTSKSVVHEDVRLKYRYLDLRNQKVKDNIIFRSKVISYLREKIQVWDFWSYRHRSCAHLLQRVQEIISYHLENSRENFMHCHRHHSSTSSF